MDTRQRVSKLIEQNGDELIRFLSYLVRIPSINIGDPDTGEEGTVQAYIADYMRGMGLEVDMRAYDDKQERPNVVGRLRGEGGGESLLINAHSDVVPISEPQKWSIAPFGGEVRDGRIWGRGTADDKQGIASMIFAVKALQQAGVRLKGDVVLLSSVGEESNEGGTLGAGRAMQDDSEKPSFALVCESTGAKDLDIEGPSLFFFELTVLGKAVHVGDRNMVVFPQPHNIPCGNEFGADALQKSLPIIEMLYRLGTDWAINWREGMVGCGGTSTFDKKGVGVFGLNICSINGGTYLGSVPGEVTLMCSVFHPQDISSEELFAKITENVMAVAKTDSWLAEHPPVLKLRYDCHYWQGFKVKPEHPGVLAAQRAHLAMTGDEVNLSGFKAVCDATYLQRVGIPSVVYGAGESGYGVHGVDESCSIPLIIRTCKFLAGMMLEWCEEA